MLETSSQDSNNANKKDVTQGLSGTDLSFSDVARTKNKLQRKNLILSHS